MASPTQANIPQISRSSLLGLLQTPSLGAQILSYLRFADTQRLKVSCRALQELLKREEQFTAIVAWLENVEALYCVKGDNNDALVAKMAISMQEHPDRARFLSHDTASNQTDELSRNNVLEAYHNYAYLSFEPNLGEDFADFPGWRLGELCTEHEDENAFFEIGVDSDSESDEDDEESEGKQEGQNESKQQQQKTSESDNSEASENSRSRKRHKAMECTSRRTSSCCYGEGQAIERFFFVPDKPYCGYCLDGCDLLKLRFCARHVKAGDADWSIGEIDYEEMEKNNEEDVYEWGLQEDEFMVEVFRVSPYESGWIRFIGVGPRD